MIDPKGYLFDSGHGLYVSELKVMQSNAGFYIGRDCFEGIEPEWKQPYSRESQYFATQSQADIWLLGIQASCTELD